MARIVARFSRFSMIACVLLALGSWPSFAHPVAATPCDVPLPVDDERASELLAEERPFALTDPDILFSYGNPDWHEAAPIDLPAGPALSEQQTAEALRAFLERRFSCTPARVQDGMKYFSDPIARIKLPDPTLRAALAALTGTLGEPAIQFVLYTTPIRLVTFSMFIELNEGLPSRIAGGYRHMDGTQSILIDRRLRFLPFGAFSALLAHEVLHAGVDDDTAGLPEESVASAIEALIYMEMLLTDPSLAYLPDFLTRLSNNHVAIARVNSGPAGTDRLTLFVPDSEENIDPLAVEPLSEFYEFYALHNAPTDDPDFRERESEGNELLRDMLDLLAEPGASPPEDADFDQETVAFVDQNQAILTPGELIAAACILKLNIPCD